MWRPYLIYVVNALKLTALGAVAVAAWYLALWVRGGDYGHGLYVVDEVGGLSTEFLSLFLLFLFIGTLIATPLLWGWRRRGTTTTSEGWPNVGGDGI